MLAAVVGGGLQGVEAAYLAHKAGWEVQLIDRKRDVPASGLSDRFIREDITRPGVLDSLPKDLSIVIPATENRAALDSLHAWSRTAGIPVAYDAQAYAVSSSKLESGRLFVRQGIPAPRSWPECDFPVIAKPSSGSGSKAVQYIRNRQQMEELFPVGKPPEDWVIQEYVEGPSYSLEVVGTPGRYTTFRVTDLEMDAGYDCKRVKAPTELPPELIERMESISLKIAGAIGLRGIMDVEAILSGGELKVLEIDARLPSQTPTAVFQSTGVNMLEWLCRVYLEMELPPSPATAASRGVIYEHIQVSPGGIDVCGEHIMKGENVGPLKLHRDFFGADEAVTNYRPGAGRWVATLIIVGKDQAEATAKRNEIINNIQVHMNLGENSYRDPVPAEIRRGQPGLAQDGPAAHEKSDEREPYDDTT